MVRRNWTLSLTALLAFACSAVAEDGFVSLFDGKTLSGWEMKANANNRDKSKWEVKDGVIVGSGNASMLYSPKGNYKNFIFRAEISINDKGNSGLYFRTPADPNGDFSKGYECQINATHGDPIKTGSLYTMVHLDKAAHGPDEFYTEEVEVQDVMYRGKPITRIKVRVNGKLLYEFQDFAPAWKEGHFGFQQHDPGSVVKIRKIEVKELPSGVK
jgi:hypothetical protein